ncbi:MAG: glycosyltransferase [Dysgonomonas sp.]|nr:glycosyltransferase [Dysgonomonas sp.]
MKIFQIITVSEYGGAQTVVADLVKSLSTEHKVFLLFGGKGEAWNNLGDNFIKIKLNDHRKQVSWKDGILLLKLFYYRFKYNPDVIHLHSSKMGVLGRIAFNPKKIVYTVHGFDSIRKAYPKYLSIERFLKNRVFRIVGVSKYDVDGLKEEGIVRNVECIYNGVADYSGETFNIKDKIDNELGRIKQEYPKIIMCISRISKQKKFDLFLDIAKQFPEYAFVWIGNKEEIKGLPSNVYCLGEAHSAYRYLLFANLFLLPSNYEGLPISLLEALSFGVPVVASAVGGITEVLDDKNGFAVSNDVLSFKEKINYVFSDKKIEKEMSLHARESYLTNFTVEKMVDGYMSIFNTIVANKK